jgi:hypothetical protein
MRLQELMGRYDFCESELIECRLDHGTRAMQLTVDYYWDLEAKSQAIGPSQLVKVTFRQCRKMIMLNDQAYLTSSVEAGTPLTIISWGDATGVAVYQDFCRDMLPEELAVNFQLVGPGGDSRLLMICGSIDVEHRGS